MGGQAFSAGGVLVDTSGLDRVLGLDRERGTVDVEAGITWPALVAWLIAAQGGRAGTWGIRQKQTGADRLSLGGALAANIHGRGLRSPPFVADIESFELIGPDGEHCAAAVPTILGTFAVPSAVTACSGPSRR